MSKNFFSGFEKQALEKQGISAKNTLLGLGSVLGAAGGSSAGMGAGLLTRSKFEDKLKKKKDKTPKDKALADLPAYLGTLGLLAGGAHGYRKTNKALSKFAALKRDVKLKDHQRRAIERMEENDGNLLAAHATGSGKTLTGIAGFEKLKDKGKAKKALVVVPASLRKNFEEGGVKKFTDSPIAVYGSKNEKSTKNIGDKSDADYNVVSYDLFREHGDQLLEDTGADTLIMDEVHRTRSTEGSTYQKIKDLRPKFKQAITLTGSVVNNEPNDVVPLMDMTYGNKGHSLLNKNFFDRTFVQKDARKEGFFNPKVHVEKNLKNKNQLGKYLKGKADFISHEDLAKDLPERVQEDIEVDMTPEQTELYNFNLTGVDPITRWKIRNNLPVGQKEAANAFAKLDKARQVSSDPGVLSEEERKKKPYDRSPKIRRVVDDALEHVGKDKKNKTVVFGNFIGSQLEPVEETLKEKGARYSKFVGTGQKGSTKKEREKAIEDFNKGDSQILLLSSAGGEGLDLKDTNMMQMMEGHYNPEKILQAESRIRRLGAFKDKKPEDRKVTIRRYHARPKETGVSGAIKGFYSKMGLQGDSGTDKWIYTVAERKDDLNRQFRDVLRKDTAEYKNMQKSAARDDDDEEGPLMGPVKAEMRAIGNSLGQVPGNFLGKKIEKGTDKEIEAKLKQKLLDRQKEGLTQKRHYNKILAESKLDEKVLDAKQGLEGTVVGAGLLKALNDITGQKSKNKVVKKLSKGFDKAVLAALPKKFKSGPLARAVAPALVGGGLAGLALPPAKEKLKHKILTGALSGETPEIDEGIRRYEDKLRKRMEKKYKSSKDFVTEYDTKKELGIDPIN